MTEVVVPLDHDQFEPTYNSTKQISNSKAEITLDEPEAVVEVDLSYDNKKLIDNNNNNSNHFIPVKVGGFKKIKSTANGGKGELVPLLVNTDSSDALKRDPGVFVDTMLRCLPGIFLWGIIIGSSVLAIVDPRGFFIVSTLYAIYNLWVMANIGCFIIKALKLWNTAENVDFYSEYTQKRNNMLREGYLETSLLEWNNIVHYLIIPNYNEHQSILAQTVNNLTKSAIAKTHLVVVLAMEAREAGAEEKAKSLVEKYGHNFYGMMYAMHPRDIPNECACKGSNTKWALSKVNEDVQNRQLNIKNVCITICDADSVINPKYWECLTGRFCLDTRREETLWQAPMGCYKNLLSVPAPTRCLAIAVTVHEFAVLANEHDIHVPFSTYSSPLTYFNRVGIDPTVITEDWAIFLKGFFVTSGRARIEAIPLPNLCYAAEKETYCDSLVERFTQAKRHAWACEQIVYFAKSFWRLYFMGPNQEAKNNLLRAFVLLFKISGLHAVAGLGFYFLVIPFLVINLYTFVPGLTESALQPYIVGEWSLAFRILTYLSFVPNALTLMTNYFLVKKVLGDDLKWYHNIKFILEFVIIGPVANLVYATIPTIIACTRLFWTDKYQFVSAPKPKIKSQDDMDVNI